MRRQRPALPFPRLPVVPTLSSSRRRLAAAALALGALPALVAAHRPPPADALRPAGEAAGFLDSLRSLGMTVGHPERRAEGVGRSERRAEGPSPRHSERRAEGPESRNPAVAPPVSRKPEDSHLAGITTGSYVAVLANGQKLPWTTQVPAVEGLAHWARLDLAVLRLNANGRYTLSYRYAQEVVDTRAKLQMPPARDEISVGRYSDKGRTLTFVPTPSPGKTARTVTAQVVGADIYLDKTMFVGERPFRVRLLFRRDPSLW